MLKKRLVDKSSIPYVAYALSLLIVGGLAGYLQSISLKGHCYFAYACFFWGILGILPPVRKRLNVKDLIALATIGLLGLPTIIGTFFVAASFLGEHFRNHQIVDTGIELVDLFALCHFRGVAVIAILLISVLVLLRFRARRWIVLLRRKGKLRLRMPASRRFRNSLKIVIHALVIVLSIPVLMDAAGIAIVLWSKAPHRLSSRDFAVFEREMHLFADVQECRRRRSEKTEERPSTVLSPPTWYVPRRILRAWPFGNVSSCIEITTQDGKTGWVDAYFGGSGYLIDSSREKISTDIYRWGTYPAAMIVRPSSAVRYIFDGSQSCLSCADGKGNQEECGAMSDEGEHIVIPGEKSMVVDKKYRLSDHMPCLEIELEDGRHGWILGLGEDLSHSRHLPEYGGEQQ